MTENNGNSGRRTGSPPDEERLTWSVTPVIKRAILHESARPQLPIDDRETDSHCRHSRPGAHRWRGDGRSIDGRERAVPARTNRRGCSQLLG